ncbi:MAG: galactokinase [Caldilineaceae bacterium]|nr:galactokinase [Caldilineaceae bacterium]
MTDMTPPAEQGDKRNQTMILAFREHFGAEPTHVVIGPGRVNLIGEHTDYNDGFVLPVAIKRDVRLVLRPRNDRIVRIVSLDYDGEAAFDLDALHPDPERLWLNYVQGVAQELDIRGVTLAGFDAVLSGNVPRASGLSSSAALEIAAAHSLLVASRQTDVLDGPAIAQAAQAAENNFVGVKCGIMDQFISELGREGHALLIDCRTLAYDLIPMPPEAALIIGNTKASRSLAGSAYNTRRQECEEGVARLRQALPHIRALRDVSSEELEANKELLPDLIYRRCRHIVTENERVLATVTALQQGKLDEVGRLMNASHASLCDDYAVSSDALDVMVAAMQSTPGCYGARLTGAGFGGCAVGLVAPGAEQQVADAIYRDYPQATGIWPEVYTTHAANGAHVITL